MSARPGVQKYTATPLRSVNYPYPDIFSKSRFPVPSSSLQHLPEENMGPHQILYPVDVSSISSCHQTTNVMQGIGVLKWTCVPHPGLIRPAPSMRRQDLLPFCRAHLHCFHCPALAFLLHRPWSGNKQLHSSPLGIAEVQLQFSFNHTLKITGSNLKKIFNK